MRNIEFRGISTKSNKFVYGYYVSDGKEYHAIASENPSDDSEMLNQPVHSKTVGQFTGVFDKDNVKIFEGDIVHGEYIENYTVTFSECDASVQGSVCDVPLIGFNYGGLPLATDINYEVVGNIHEVKHD